MYQGNLREAFQDHHTNMSIGGRLLRTTSLMAGRSRELQDLADSLAVEIGREKSELILNAAGHVLPLADKTIFWEGLIYFVQNRERTRVTRRFYQHLSFLSSIYTRRWYIYTHTSRCPLRFINFPIYHRQFDSLIVRVDGCM